MKNLYIGVDGGGTKTAMVCIDDGGRCVAKCVCGPLNYNFVGVDAAVRELKRGVELLAVDKSRIAAVGIGDPSLDDEPESEASLCFLEKAKEFLEAPTFARSDAYITLFGITEGKRAGVLVVSGTGAIAIGEGLDGRISVAGGWGRLTGDEGSGYYIGLSGVREALMTGDGMSGSYTIMRAALDYFNIKDTRELVAYLYSDDAKDVAGFAPLVSECASRGDEGAKRILVSAARYLALMCSSVLKKTGGDTVGVYGSVLCKEMTVRREFERLVLADFPEVNICDVTMSAEESAARYAMKKYKEKRI